MKRKKGVLQVKRFTEKPTADVAEQFVAPAITSGTAACSSGARALWRMRYGASAQDCAPAEGDCGELRHSQVREDLRQALPEVRKHQRRLRRAGAASAKGEGKSGIYCIPASFGWNDLGSWTALTSTTAPAPQDGRATSS